MNFNAMLEKILSECTLNIDETFKVKVGKFEYTFTYREILEKIEESSEEEQMALLSEVYERSPELSVDDVLRGYLEYVSVK